MADQIALKLAGKNGYVLTEAGFGADMGMEKFFNIKCRYSGLKPDCVVLVATIRALKMHGGGPKVVAGQPLAHAYLEENLELLEKGCSNLARMIANARAFGVPVVVAVNRFKTDTPAEIECGAKIWPSRRAPKMPCSPTIGRRAEPERWTWPRPSPPPAINPAISASCIRWRLSIKAENRDHCARNVRRRGRGIFAGSRDESRAVHPARLRQAAHLHGQDPSEPQPRPNLKGAPTGFTVPVRDIRASVGAGFLYPLLGTMSTMPGLSTRPGYYEMDIDPETGRIIGLS